ncbi:MAG: OsmC family protein [Fretibacterium sp.]|nr:OsmC family protein [Fretibacterium sp.]
MAKKGKIYALKAEERDDYSFEFVSGRHHLLMSKTMKNNEMPVTWFSPVDLFFSGVAGCLGMTIRATMEERNLSYESLRIEIESAIPEESEVFAFRNVKTKVFMKTSASLEDVKSVVEESEATCAVRSTIDHHPNFETEVFLEE